MYVVLAPFHVFPLIFIVSASGLDGNIWFQVRKKYMVTPSVYLQKALYIVYRIAQGIAQGFVTRTSCYLYSESRDSICNLYVLCIAFNKIPLHTGWERERGETDLWNWNRDNSCFVLYLLNFFHFVSFLEWNWKISFFSIRIGTRVILSFSFIQIEKSFFFSPTVTRQKITKYYSFVSTYIIYPFFWCEIDIVINHNR